MRGIWKYRHLLSSLGEADMVTLGEGNTPLIHAGRLGKKCNISRLYLKVESGNPSGSYKDRFAASVLSHLKAKNAKLCLATSSGNTGAALAAYSAREGIPCVLAVVDGAPASKLKQMRLYGADTMMIRDFGKDEEVSQAVFDQLESLGNSLNSKIQVSAYRYSPEGMQGVETIAFEIAEELEDHQALQVFSPSGGGGLTLAVGKGFKKWKAHNQGYCLPVLHCVQPEGNNTIAGALMSGLDRVTPIMASTTRVSGLQVPNIIDGQETLELCRELKGTGHLVSDEMIYQCQYDLAIYEGIYCEPAGAVALAGAIQARRNGEIGDEPVICLVTGHGYKDSESLDRMVGEDQETFPDIISVINRINKLINNE